MEATWLAALICIPTFFSAWGEAIQSEKNYLLRSLAIVLLTAWMIKALPRFWKGTFKPKDFSIKLLLQMPLVAPAALLAFAWAAATLVSLSPWDSFWGVYYVRDGSYTYFCCLLFFAAIASNIHSFEQVDRIITAVILTSIPICLYGIGQRFSIEPVVVTQGRDLFRVGSTLGNAIFLGAYLIMIVPLTLCRMIYCYLAFRSRAAFWKIHFIQGSLYALIAILQLATMICTVSRGPVLGLFAGSCVLLMLLAIFWRKKRLVVITLAAGIMMIVSLGLLSHSIGPLRNVADRPEVKRFIEMLNPKTGSSGRTAIWNEAVQASHFSKVVQTAEGRKDPFARARFIFGYGPESVVTVYRQYRSQEYNIAMADVAYLDRFHNDFWDTLITTGLLGEAAYLALTFLILYFGCKWLGFISTPQQRAMFWSLQFGGATVGSLALIAWQGLGFLGVGLRFGSWMGLLAFFVCVVWRKKCNTKPTGALDVRVLLLTALFSGLVAHLVDISFSFTTETTLLYFWIYVALLFVIGYRFSALETNRNPGDMTASSTIPPRGKSAVESSVRLMRYSWQREMTGGLVMSIFWLNLGFMLIRNSGTNSAVETVAHSLTRLPGNENAFTWVLIVGVVSMGLLFGVMWSNETREKLARPWWKSFLVITTISASTALWYWLTLATRAAGMLMPSDAKPATLDRLFQDYTFIVDFHYGFMFLMILLLATSLSREREVPEILPVRSIWFVGTAGVLAFGAPVLIYLTNMKWSKAGVADNMAKYFMRDNEWPMAAAVSESAIRAVPTADFHYLTLGKSLIEQTAAAKSADERLALSLKAERALEAGHKLRPLNPAPLIERGNLYLKLALAETAADRKRALGMKALQFFQHAAVLDPGDYDLWNKMAYVKLVVSSSLDEAHKLVLRSLDLFPNSHKTHCLLGDVLSQKGFASQNSGERTAFFRSAATSYERAIDLVGTNNETAHFQYLYATSLGKSRVRLHDRPQAITAYQYALRVAPPSERWNHEETLARLFADIKDKSNATEHAQRAIELAPAEKRAGLMDLKNKILATLRDGQ